MGRCLPTVLDSESEVYKVQHSAGSQMRQVSEAIPIAHDTIKGMPRFGASHLIVNPGAGAAEVRAQV